MSCGLILAAALAFTDPVVAAPPAEVVGEAPASVAAEPLFAEIVSQSRSLKAVVEGWMASGQSEQQGFWSGSVFGRFKADAEALAAQDMRGHETLKARNQDGDLKCILRGISEDMPKRITAIETASNAAQRRAALEDMVYLLNDNAEVITAPPQPPVISED